jgi:hypothetical protein
VDAGTYGIPGAIIVYLVANLALMMERVEFRRHGVADHPFLGAVGRNARENALALLTGDEALTTDPLPPVTVRN